MCFAKASILYFGVLVSTPSLATAVPEPEAATAATPQMLVSRYYDDLFGERFSAALSDIADLRPDDSNPEGQAVVAAMRASALLGLKREADAEQLIAQVDHLSPRDPTARSILFQGALMSDHFGIAAASIDMLIANFPNAARDLDWNLVRYFLAHEPKGEERKNEDRRIALARINYGDDTDVGHWRAVDAINILADRGDVVHAGELLGRVEDVEPIENMLVQKRFSALWPKLAEIAGTHLSKVRAAAVESSERAYLAAPGDMEKLQSYVGALRKAGRLNDAIGLRSKLPATPAAMAETDEKTGWAINEMAYALRDAGRVDDADRLFAMLNDPERTDASWRVSMFINRLEMLVSAGKFEKAATLLDATEESAKNDGNDYARQLVRRLRFCVLSSTGKKSEAEKVVPDLLQHANDALEPTVDGLLCGGDLSDAQQLVVRGLNSTDKEKRRRFEEQFVRDMQPVPLTADDLSAWRISWNALRKSPEIAAAYEKLGRDMPDDLRPDIVPAIAQK